jgi:ATP-dependent exoDNAse (exonuclease V) beta subunit
MPKWFYKSDVDAMGRRTRTAIEFKDAPVMEKNLFYVAVTRAKRNLELGLSQRLFSVEKSANTVIPKAA